MIKEDNNVVEISLEKLEVNKGQLEGLPENPREMTEREFKLLKANIKKYPKLLNKRGLLVYPLENGNYIIIGGNMRYEALKALKYKSAPCQIIEKETDIETLKAYTLIENKHYGKWDWDAIANQWEELQLEEIGIELPIFEGSEGFKPNEYGKEPSLPSGDKNNAEKITFILTIEQANFIKEQLNIAQYEECDTFGNTNENGNAIYSIVKQWADVKKLNQSEEDDREEEKERTR